MPRIAIFASGNGSNAQRIAEYFSGHPGISVGLILTNNPEAYVLRRAENLGIRSVFFDRDTFYHTGSIPALLKEGEIDFLVLAGFLWLVPPGILAAYPGRILNIHPALLPKYGGKGMYGMRVHEAVIAAGEHESGISIHVVDDRYDEGKIIFQARCPVSENDTPETLAGKVHELEYRHFPGVIEEFITRNASR